MTITIAIDCMGGDAGTVVTIPSALAFIERHPDTTLLLVGLEEKIRTELVRLKALDHPRLVCLHAPEVVTMDDSIETALRRKKQSSMRIAIEQVKSGAAQSCVSAGNTGALMAVSRYVLKTLPGVDRPAICTILPNQKDGPTYMLDLGANVDCEAEHLRQFALMGSALVAELEGKSAPTIGLLNVGHEDIKGNEVVKQAGVLLRAEHAAGRLNFFGNVEGNNIFEGTVDIVVCDGFVGNVTLKASEGLGRLVKNVLQTEFRRGFFNMIGALIAQRALTAISRRLNPSRYNGAALLGLRGLVFKSHGSANVEGFCAALERAYEAARQDVQNRIAENIAQLMRERTGASGVERDIDSSPPLTCIAEAG